MNEQIDFNTKLKQTKNLLNYAMCNLKNPYISFSGGLNSTVMLYFITQDCGYKIMPIFNHSDKSYYPDIPNYISMMKDKYKLNIEVVDTDYKIILHLRHFNIKINEIEDENDEKYKKYKSIRNKIFRDSLKLYRGLQPLLDGVFIGYRREQSEHRELNYKKRGSLYYKKSDNIKVCTILSNWTLENIYEYININNIPVLNLYNKFDEHNKAEHKILPKRKEQPVFSLWLFPPP